jgi:hypothetical protein
MGDVMTNWACERMAKEVLLLGEDFCALLNKLWESYFSGR